MSTWRFSRDQSSISVHWKKLLFTPSPTLPFRCARHERTSRALTRSVIHFQNNSNSKCFLFSVSQHQRINYGWWSMLFENEIHPVIGDDVWKHIRRKREKETCASIHRSIHHDEGMDIDVDVRLPVFAHPMNTDTLTLEMLFVRLLCFARVNRRSDLNTTLRNEHMHSSSDYVSQRTELELSWTWIQLGIYLPGNAGLIVSEKSMPSVWSIRLLIMCKARMILLFHTLSKRSRIITSWHVSQTSAHRSSRTALSIHQFDLSTRRCT